jgi:ribose transport system substrate-binding protein
MGVAGDAAPKNISAGDGSAAAFQRIAGNGHQVGTVAEPLRLHAFQLIDDLNRVFAGQPASNYVFPVHLFTPENVNNDRGPDGLFDPQNGYEQIFKKIWQK